MELSFYIVKCIKLREEYKSHLLSLNKLSKLNKLQFKKKMKNSCKMIWNKFQNKVRK